MVIWSWASPTLILTVPPDTNVSTLDLGTDTDYKGMGKEVLSDDGTTITWTIPTNSEEDGIIFP